MRFITYLLYIYVFYQKERNFLEF